LPPYGAPQFPGFNLRRPLEYAHLVPPPPSSIFCFCVDTFFFWGDMVVFSRHAFSRVLCAVGFLFPILTRHRPASCRSGPLSFFSREDFSLNLPSRNFPGAGFCLRRFPKEPDILRPFFPVSVFSHFRAGLISFQFRCVDRLLPVFFASPKPCSRYSMRAIALSC